MRGYLGLGLALIVQATPATPQAQAQRELERVRAAIASLESDLQTARRNRSAASQALEEHERAIDGIAKERRRLATSAEKLAGELERLHAARDDLATDMNRERDALGQQLRVAYALGREDRLKLILQRRDLGSTTRLLRYHQHFTRERRKRIAALATTMARVQETEVAIARESRRLEEIRAEQARRQEALTAQRARREQALAALDAEFTSANTRLAVLERDRARLAALVERLRDVLNDIPKELEPPRSFKALRGRLPWPVKGQVARRYGSTRPETGLRWQGVVLEAPAGRDVRAVAHGRVVFADWLRGFGLMITLDHGGGYMSLYGHNESLLREPGEWVNPGDSLATVGDSGTHARAGLYFEIRRDGRPQDPARWCSAKAGFRAAL